MVRDYDLLGKIQYYVKLTSPALSILSSVKIQVWLLELNGSPPGSPASPAALFLSFFLSLSLSLLV